MSKSATRVTLQDIADEVGVSYATVARVMAGKLKGTWASANRRADEIRQVAARLGYRPNAAARATVSGRFDAAALLSRSDSNFLPFALLQGVFEGLSARDMHLSLAHLSKASIAEEAHEPKLLRELCVDGLLVHEALDIPPALIEMVDRHRVPTVWINSLGPFDCVYPDDTGGIRASVERLVALGHRRVTYAEALIEWRNGDTHYSVMHRRQGYARAMTAAGLTESYFSCVYPSTPENGPPWQTPADDRVERAVGLLGRPDRPTAIVTHSLDAAGPIVRAADRLGLSVPRDLTVVVPHHEKTADHGWPTGVAVIPMREVGLEAVRVLCERIAEPGTRVPPVAVPYKQFEGAWAPPAAA